METWETEREIFEFMRNYLNSAILGDILDELGRYHQFLPPQIRPITSDMKVAGKAMPVLEADAYEVKSKGVNPYMKKDFGLMLEALDSLGEDEIYICGVPSLRYALVGELMATRMKKLGAAGAIMYGYHRDTNGILALDFPCFSIGAYAQDQAVRGKVIDYRVPIEIGNVRIEPGDFVFGDMEGVLIIPSDISHEVVKKAGERLGKEKIALKSIQEGMSAVDSFALHGIM